MQASQGMGLPSSFSNPFGRDDLLRRGEIAGIDLRLACLDVAAQPVVDDDAGLQRRTIFTSSVARHASPRMVIVGEVKPDNVDLSVVRQQLLDLVVQVVGVARQVPGCSL